MNPRRKGREEIAFNRGSLIMEEAYQKAVEAGADPDDLVWLIYQLATRGRDYRYQSRAIRESAFDLRLHPKRQSEASPTRDPGAPPQALNNSCPFLLTLLTISQEKELPQGGAV
jgi:hypothetical protein